MLTPVIMLGLLITPWASARLVLASAAQQRFAGVLGLVLVFWFTGVGHFLKTQDMAAMLPQALPARVPAVYLAGILELVLAFMLLRPGWRRIAGWCLIVMLVLFLPVNVYAAIERVPMGGHAWGPAYLLVRVPL